MARPAQKQESSRDKIHEAALRLFARHGFEGVGMQRIANEVGLHKSSLFHHYDSKLDLAREVYEACVERVLVRVRVLADDDPPRLETLLELLDDLVDMFSDSPDDARLLIQVMTAPLEGDVRQDIRDNPDHPVAEFMTTLWSWLQRAKHSGAVRAFNVQQAMFNLIGLVLFYPAAAEQEPDLAGSTPFSPSARRHRKRELRFMVRGLMASEI
jgi:AcrR family transcriptional regulator